MSIWSSMTSVLEDAKSQLNDMKQNRKFARINADMKAKSELQYSLGKCRGKLEGCKKDFNRIIRNQSRYIQEGQQDGMDTVINEQNLWDAALGYMLVKGAIFALKTVADYDSITHAYEMLDAASRQISGQGPKRIQAPWKKRGNAMIMTTSPPTAPSRKKRSCWKDSSRN
ncbi:MAG: hypothetical protein LUD78_12605 [Clostridiales bacterium]|nr:hypothetical protein [Clostridiales bacterium]